MEMRCKLFRSPERKAIREEHKLGFPYPVIKRTWKTNLIGGIPLNELNDADWTSMFKRAPEEIKPFLDRSSILSYYDIRDIQYINTRSPTHSGNKGVKLFCYFFGDYILEFAECTNIDEAKETGVDFSVKHGESVNRVYKLSKDGWKRVRGIA